MRKILHKPRLQSLQTSALRLPLGLSRVSGRISSNFRMTRAPEVMCGELILRGAHARRTATCVRAEIFFNPAARESNADESRASLAQRIFFGRVRAVPV